ncbi:MAG TPA: polysaccharide biosynthesis/export family protein [Polyangiales bacterium]|nr:polysaccharide biosynthesis/export family protein [Polyangiales bacterium]
MSTLYAPWLLALALSMVGCTGTRVQASEVTPLARVLAVSKPYLDRGYVIAIGDSVSTRCYFNPQLDEEVTVGPDGLISLSLIGQLTAAGKTPQELSSDLTKAYSVHFQRATAVVSVRSFAAYRVFTAGELRRPGMFSLVNNAGTVLESIAASGGATAEATLHRVILVRRLPSQREPMIARLDVASALSGVDPSQNVKLLPGDYVYVPRAGAAELNLGMRQYLLDNFNTTFQLGLTLPPVDIAR